MSAAGRFRKAIRGCGSAGPASSTPSRSLTFDWLTHTRTPTLIATLTQSPTLTGRRRRFRAAGCWRTWTTQRQPFRSRCSWRSSARSSGKPPIASADYENPGLVHDCQIDKHCQSRVPLSRSNFHEAGSKQFQSVAAVVVNFHGFQDKTVHRSAVEYLNGSIGGKRDPIFRSMYRTVEDALAACASLSPRKPCWNFADICPECSIALLHLFSGSLSYAHVEAGLRLDPKPVASPAALQTDNVFPHLRAVRRPP